MRKASKIAALAAVAFMSTTAIADHHAGDKKDKMNAGDASTMGLVPSGVIMPWGLGFPYPTSWSIFDPFLLDMPGGGKGIPVHDANDATKIIGYVKMPARPKPTGPVHCMIKETGLLAKSVDDCEAAGGSVAK